MTFKVKCSIKLYIENNELIFSSDNCFLLVNREIKNCKTKEADIHISGKIHWNVQIMDVLDFKYFGKIFKINIIDVENIEYSGNVLYIPNSGLIGNGILNGLTYA